MRPSSSMLNSNRRRESEEAYGVARSTVPVEPPDRPVTVLIEPPVPVVDFEIESTVHHVEPVSGFRQFVAVVLSVWILCLVATLIIRMTSS